MVKKLIIIIIIFSACFNVKAQEGAITADSYPEALQSLSIVLKKTPNDLSAKKAVVEIVLKAIKPNVGSVYNVTALDNAVKQFPFLTQDSAIQKAYVFNYGLLTSIAFSRSDKNNGDKYLKLLCTELDGIKACAQFDWEEVGTPFVNASDYYLAKQSKQKALQILNNGLKYSPDNVFIINKLKFLKKVQPAVRKTQQRHDK